MAIEYTACHKACVGFNFSELNTHTMMQDPSGSHTDAPDAETDGVDSDDDNDVLKSAQVQHHAPAIYIVHLHCSTFLQAMRMHEHSHSLHTLSTLQAGCLSLHSLKWIQDVNHNLLRQEQ